MTAHTLCGASLGVAAGASLVLFGARLSLPGYAFAAVAGNAWHAYAFALALYLAASAGPGEEPP